MEGQARERGRREEREDCQSERTQRLRLSQRREQTGRKKEELKDARRELEKRKQEGSRKKEDERKEEEEKKQITGRDSWKGKGRTEEAKPMSSYFVSRQNN